MKEVKKLFLRTMINELGYAEDNGFILDTPVTVGMNPQEFIDSSNLLFPKTLTDFYAQVSNLKVLWEIYESDENTKQFKEDEYLIEKYFNNDYDWGVVKDFLTGFINITHSNDIFNPDFCKEQAYYYILKNKVENEDDFFPFDIQSDVTACLKKETNSIIDNIWLIHTSAEQVYDMKISLEEYLQLAYEAKCIHNWQLVYLFKDKIEEYQIMKRFLPKIFSHVTLNLSKFGI